MTRTLLLATPALALLGLATALPAQSRPDGAVIFKQRCASCHVASPNATTRLAPNLAGVTGRKAGTSAGFNYSPALKGANITWTRANLDKYLQGPTRMVPGTRMVISVPDKAQRAAILDHLSRLK